MITKNLSGTCRKKNDVINSEAEILTLKAHVSEEILNWHGLSFSLSATLSIHSYCLNQLGQASQRNMFQSSAFLRLKDSFC